VDFASLDATLKGLKVETCIAMGVSLWGYKIGTVSFIRPVIILPSVWLVRQDRKGINTLAF